MGPYKVVVMGRVVSEYNTFCDVAGVNPVFWEIQMKHFGQIGALTSFHFRMFFLYFVCKIQNSTMLCPISYRLRNFATLSI